MATSGSAVAASSASTFQGDLKNCIRAGTDHIIITNPSGAGMDKDFESPRHKFNNERIKLLNDADNQKLMMSKAFVRSKLSFNHNAYGWLKREDAETLGARVQQSGLGDCDLCAAAAIYVMSQCPRVNHAKVEAFGTGGHAFVVVNRRDGSDDSDLTTWGAECLVVDVWSCNQGISEEAVMSPNQYLGYFGGSLSPTRLM